MDKRELTCINCPLGCALTVTINEGTVTVTGNTCPRGEEYGRKEVTAPTRIITGTVTVRGGTLPRVSVKTAKDIPKGSIFDVCEEIRRAEVSAPVHIGDIIIKDCAGTGVSIIATKDIEIGGKKR